MATTLEGAKGEGALPTFVERKSRYLIAAKLADKKAATMNTKSVISFQKLTRPLLQTITVDNGKEISLFKELKAKTGLTVYFADPYATWQRGTYENTNGLLRFYFPKRTDFLAITKEELNLII